MSFLPTHLSSTPLAKGLASTLHQPIGVQSAEVENAFATDYPVIAFSHLGWDWVWQRPQQYLSRLARGRRVLFVESRQADQPTTTLRTYKPEGHPNLVVCEIHFPRERWEDTAYIDKARLDALKNLLSGELEGKFDQPVLWFYDPMAVEVIGALNERAIVYDCMDELSQFKGARKELIPRDRQLVQRADVVFCGGRRMAEKRRPLNPNTHFIGTGVDCEHFGQARTRALEPDPVVDGLFGPVLGYFGVIDERIDYDLVAALADADPTWSIAMVGPHVKVDPMDFPKRKNLHWLGGKPYNQLPAITKAFDVCLMPFALNDATEYINPTKALEYMAAGKPVVSTALSEVRSNFADVARIALTHAEFVQLCKIEAYSPSRLRIRRGVSLAERNTWEANLGRMEGLINEAVRARSSRTSPASSSSQLKSSVSTRTEPSYV